MAAHEATLVERLSGVKNPRDLYDWTDRDGYYVSACRVSADDVPRLIDIAVRWGDWDWLENQREIDADLVEVEMLPITAWRTLADLKAEAAIQPLIDLLRKLEEFDDWSGEELPPVFGKLGECAIGPLTQLATDRDAQEFARSTAVRGLSQVAHYHPKTRDRIVASLTEMMSNAADDDLNFNSSVLAELVELHAVEAAEPIERAFAANALDVGMAGDWEAVRQELGVPGLGLKMPERPHNSLEQLRRGMGLGTFALRPIFYRGELDEDAAREYYDRAYDSFSKSDEARQVIERGDDSGWMSMLLQFGLDYLGETVDEMTQGSVSEFVLDYVPRKVSTEPDAAESIIFELTKFWEYLNRVYQLPNAKSIIEWLEADDLVERLKTEMSNPANFGMAKSLFMTGRNSGYDMTSEAGIAEFMAAYNQSLRANRVPATPAAAPPSVRRQRIGRNAPCPCGSGKKFKKCCGG